MEEHLHFSVIKKCQTIHLRVGTLDLALNPSTVVNVSNLKPGDTIEKEFKLENKGSLDIKKGSTENRL